jgi:HSP20 family molecular chaperone IbpA
MFVVRQRGARSVDRIQSEMEDLFHTMSSANRPLRIRVQQGRSSAWRPPIEVYETDDALIVLAEIAGLRDEDIQVVLDDTILSIRGDRRPLCDDGHRSIHEMGILYGPFAADVYLPFAIVQDAVQASYDNGLLRVQMPRPARTQIPVSSEHHSPAGA